MANVTYRKTKRKMECIKIMKFWIGVEFGLDGWQLNRDFEIPSALLDWIEQRENGTNLVPQILRDLI
jgi:hypothetical protein